MDTVTTQAQKLVQTILAQRRNAKLHEMALMATRYIVKAQAYNRKTQEPVGQSREEEIDVSTNQLFKTVTNIGDVEAAYEAFWNELDPTSNEIVKVISITAV
jgi:hypothetical protein